MGLLTKTPARDYVSRIWALARLRSNAVGRRCPVCAGPLVEVPSPPDFVSPVLDVCRRCHLFRFAPREFDQVTPLSHLAQPGLFGDDVGKYLGHRRFLWLAGLDTLVGGLAHADYDSRCNIPVLGANGGISGLVTLCGLKCPQAKMVSLHLVPLDAGPGVQLSDLFGGACKASPPGSRSPG